MKAPTAESFQILAAARNAAKEFGESFVVFVGGLASYANFDKGAAQHQARELSKKHGRDNVSVKRIRV